MTENLVLSDDTNKIYGVACNDLNYTITKSIRIAGKKTILWRCPYYTKWCGMVERVYSLNFKNKWPSYENCTLEPEWLYLSKFKHWVDHQPNKNWEQCELDKDLLVIGNKHYGPDTCVFISEKLNSFILESTKTRSCYLIGVQYINKTGKYRARCSNPFTGKLEHLGMFDDELSAHLCWKEKKYSHAEKIVQNEGDPRVVEALLSRYKT